VKGLLSSFPRKAVWQLTLLHHGHTWRRTEE
jgi:hypothetical protein